MKPTKSDVYVDPVLTNISIAYQNEDYISEKILPLVKVAKDSGYYFKYDKSKFRPVNDERAPGTRAARVGYGLVKATYGPIIEHALEQEVPDEIVEQADNPLDPKFDATENVTERILVAKERKLAVVMADTSILTQNVTLSGTSQWSDYANSDPISDIKRGKQVIHASIFREPNTLVLGKPVFDKLVDHPDIIDRIKYSALGVATTDLLARLFGVNNVIIAGAGYNTAKEGQADVMDYIWGKHAWLLYIEPNPGIRRLSFGYTFYTNPRKVESWYEQQIKSTIIRVSDYYEQKLVAVEAAYLIKNAVA